MPKDYCPSIETPDFQESVLALIVTVATKVTGQPVCSQHVALKTTCELTQLDFEDEAWSLSVRQQLVASDNREAYRFEWD